MTESEILEALQELSRGVEQFKRTLNEIGAPTTSGGAKLNLHGRLVDWLAGRRHPKHTGESEVVIVRHVPTRGSDVEAWIKARRDELRAASAVSNHEGSYAAQAMAIDQLLDDYRMHAATGTLLDENTGES